MKAHGSKAWVLLIHYLRACHGSQARIPTFNGYGTHLVQPKHKVFFWILLQDRLNTRGLLKRKNMMLEFYTHELCILQREETLRHLFIRCNFSRRSWESIGVDIPRHRTTFHMIQWLSGFLHGHSNPNIVEYLDNT